MTTPTPKQQLSHAARVLKRRAPEEWHVFLEAFAAFTDEAVVHVTDASAEFVQISQGQARQARTLARIFYECDQQPNLQRSQAPAR